MATAISVVVVSRNEGDNLRTTVENLQDTLPDGSDIVVVDDGSTDASTQFLKRRRRGVRLVRAAGMGVTRARNLGARRSRGDVIIFSDAHLKLPARWWKPVIDQVERPKVGAAAPVISSWENSSRRLHGLTFSGPDMGVRWLSNETRRAMAVPILPGCCLAMRRDVFVNSGGWDEGLLHRGNVDNELSVRLWLLGYELRITPLSVVSHLFRERAPYFVGWPEYIHNRLRLAFVHLQPSRLRKVVTALRDRMGFGRALLLIAQSDAARRRREMMQRRVRDDDWLFNRFQINW